MTKLLKRLVFATILLIPRHVSAQESAKQATVYEDPNCGCCQGYVDRLRTDGFQVGTIETSDLMSVKQEHGMPIGPPGMEEPKDGPFTNYEISDSEPRVFNVE